jgi:hypothetical protein
MAPNSLMKPATLLVATVVLVSGCDPGHLFLPLLAIPIAPVGKTRSPAFRLYSRAVYWIDIGLNPMKVTEAECVSMLRALDPRVPWRPCHELMPPHGAIAWTVTQRGKLVARGVLGAETIDIVRDRSNPWAKENSTGWEHHTGWVGQPGYGYVIEVDVQPSPVDLAQFHPRLEIEERWPK